MSTTEKVGVKRLMLAMKTEKLILTEQELLWSGMQNLPRKKTS